jgi:hypothetical protein
MDTPEFPQKPGINREFEIGYGKPPEATRFRPGVSANPGGRPKGRSLTARLRDLLDRNEIGGKPLKDGKQVADLVAEMIIRCALQGDFRFAKEILDRVDGKPKEAPQTEGMPEKVRAAYDRAERRRAQRDAMKGISPD